MNRKRFWAIPCFLAVFAGAVAVVMLLWNAVIPTVIGWTAVTYWQAAGLVVLCKLLFGGIGRRGFFHRHHGHFGNHAQLREDMKGMSREERRSYIRQQMAEMRGCCHTARPS